MIVGVPTEVKTDEYRVAMTPVGVEELTRTGNKVLIEAGAGQGSGISDEQYANCGGVVGANAAKIAAGLGASVDILDINLDRLRYLDDVMPGNVTTLFSDRHNILDCLRKADLVIGAVLIPGARAPRLIRRDDLKIM